MLTTPCLCDDDLRHLAANGSASERLRGHLEVCASCRSRLNVYREQSPAFGEGSDESCSRPVMSLTHGEEELAVRSTGRLPDLIGRYRVVEEIDAGGQALVYRAAHPNLRRELVIKIARRPVAFERALLTAEAKILSELKHPNLVRVYDLDVHEGRPFVVMEYVPGRNLKQVAEAARPSPMRGAAWVAGVARALALAHRRGVVHQDVKPQNILIDEEDRARLIDFGLARLTDAWADGPRRASGGTIAYMAPEQARGEVDKIDERTDVFALGGVLYFLLVGRPPFPGNDPADQLRRARVCDFDRDALEASGVPRGLAKVVRRAMAANPADRFPSADTLADALNAILSRPRRGIVLAGLLLLASVATTWSLRPAAAPAKSGPLRVEAFAVELYRGAKPLGRVGIDVFEGVYMRDSARVRARLSEPAYCYVIALNPDGSDQLYYPEDGAASPPSTDTIDTPTPVENELQGYGLTDGVGLQVVVLLASRDSLPSYAEWRRAGAKLPWDTTEATEYCAYAWQKDTDTTRGQKVPLASLPPSMKATLQVLQDRPGVAVVQARAFPVKKRREAGP